jgi:heme/copper-type cytochrome/quinol oxidase subunit 2
MLQLVQDNLNPEAMIKAAVSAAAAESAAWQAFVVSIVVLVILLIVGAVFMFMAFEMRELAKHTNGMRHDLVEATRKLALIEGNIAGRAEKAAEDKAAVKA